MNLNEYQTQAFSTAVYPRGQWREYLSLAIAGEVGETCNVLKKELRSGNRYQDRVIDEISDCLWYVAAICSEAELSFEEVVQRAQRPATRYEKIAPVSMYTLLTRVTDLQWHLLNMTNDKQLVYFLAPIVEELLWFMGLRDIRLEEVLIHNINKLQERSSTGTIKEHS